MSNEEREMSNEKIKSDFLYSLIPLEDFKALMGLDDREDKISRFCLVTAACTIEQYCKRKLLRKKHFERLEYTGDLILPLREYPVDSMNNEQVTMNNGERLEPELFRVVPDCGTNLDFPYSIELSPIVKRLRGFRSLNVVYWAGYPNGKVPADLASACLELAAWNMNRYRGRRIGMTGNVRGHGKDGEHFEMSMPTNVCQLLEPYKRKVI
jgi:hypothetical protein